MHLKILLLAVLGVSAALAELPSSPFAPREINAPPAQKETRELWHEQILDHFRPVDTRKWSQRYFVRSNSYQAGGPVFLFLGGEWDTTGGFISNTSFVGRMVDMWGGMAFELEHRFYGNSLPLPNFETENLEYLSIDQTLADAANFALAMTEAYGLTGPWIICGTSYSGMLAGFARQKYSHIFHAAYSSSGQMEAKVDFFEYHEVTGEVLAKVNPLCPGYLAAAMDQFSAYIQGQKPEDLQYIIDTFGICDSDLTKLEDAQYLYALIANLFASVVQFAFPNSIQAECDLLINGAGTPLQNLADVIKSLYPLECLFVSYEGSMEYYKNITEPFPGNNFRQYIYQTCTALGWFFTLSGNTPFGNVVPVEYFIKSCADVFGPEFSAEVIDAGVARTNLEYGGKAPDVTRILFTHGSYDGWRKVAAEQTFGDSAIVMTIADVGHAADLIYFDEDPPQLVLARIDIANQIKLWIDEFQN